MSSHPQHPAPIWTKRLERAADMLDLDDADRVYLAGLLNTWADRDLRPRLENQSTAQIAAFLRNLLPDDRAAVAGGGEANT